jgi:hypothetical protein
LTSATGSDIAPSARLQRRDARHFVPSHVARGADCHLARKHGRAFDSEADARLKSAVFISSAEDSGRFLGPAADSG